MTIPGPITLIGGREHLPGLEPADRRLIELTGVRRPHVVVLPAALADRHVPPAAALARNYWTRLGAFVTVITSSWGRGRGPDALSSADIAVLPGGHPNKLIAGLGASALTDALISRWLEGMAVAGSSAGAMSMFEWRINLYPPNPLKLIPGLGLLDGYVAAPHFDRFRAVLWTRKALPLLGGLGVVGIDESTALVGFNGAFEVFGTGSVTVVDADGLAVHRGVVPLDLLAGATRREIQVPVNPGSRFSRKAAMASVRSLERRNEEFHWAT